MTSIPRTYDRQAEACVACGERSLHTRFTKLVLGKYQADYCECLACGTLQIMNVHWLAESYGDPELDLDAGAAQRCVVCSLFLRALVRGGLLKDRAKIVDFGSGSGLFVRLLRDQGLNARGYDKYTDQWLCRDFRVPELSAESRLDADLVTAIEVFEHLPEPGTTLDTIVQNLSPDGAILLATSLYDRDRHGAGWDYLNPEHGQHINFFSRKGLSTLAQAHGLQAVFLPFGFHFLVRPGKQIGALRRMIVGMRSALYFSLARLVGMCNFVHAGQDKQMLAKERSKRPRS